MVSLAALAPALREQGTQECEIFRDIPGYEGMYQVSNLGDVISLKPGSRYGRRLSKIPHRQGYLFVCLSKQGKQRMYLIHRLVGIVFRPNPNNLPQINHINGIKSDNRDFNIEWCDAKHNSRHAWDSGLFTGTLGKTWRQIPGKTKATKDRNKQARLAAQGQVSMP